MRSGPPLVTVAALVVAVAFAACGRSGFEAPGFAGGGPLPKPKLTPALPSDFGDGGDGNLVVTTAGVTVNDCFRLVTTTAGGVVIPGNTFGIGDRIVLWQVQAVFGTAGSGAPIGTLDTAGVWEIVTVGSDSASSVVAISPAPFFAFHSGTNASAQACRLRQYQDVVVDSTGSLVAPRWNGQTGGLVGFFAAGTVEIRTGGAIDASARGFSGGLLSPPGALGYRGEGGDLRAFDVSTPKNLGNSGGGGGLTNCGGGGGAGAGAGGLGGDGIAGSPAGCGGQPGAPIAVSAATRWIPGAGGGSGQGGGGTNGPGGAGGGVVFLRVSRLIGGGGVRADGATGGFGNGDGAGGGGAGGVVFVSTSSAAGVTGSFSARGGAGGSATAAHGPGGGGGGGRILVGDTGMGSASVGAGVNGTAAGVAFGSGAGAPGVVE